MLRMRAVVGALALILVAACDHYAAQDPPALAPAPTSPADVATSSAPPAGSTVVTATAGCEPIRAADPQAIVERVRTATGCAPATQAVAYRCAPDLDPVVTLGMGATPTRYLGGRFAVPVPDVPDGAIELGAVSAGRIWSLPGTPQPVVYLEDTTGVRRWLPLPGRGAVPDPPAASLIGDSLLDGAQEELVAMMPAWALTIDAEVGRSTSGAASVAEGWFEPKPEIVVVEVAVNDHDPAVVSANLDRVVTAADHPLLLLWLTGHGPDGDVAHVNRAIEAGIGEVARGAIIDWDRLVPADALDPDGVHLLGDRQDELAGVIATWLRAWHDAALGDGATGCEGMIRAAAKREG